VFTYLQPEGEFIVEIKSRKEGAEPGEILAALNQAVEQFKSHITTPEESDNEEEG
jgi:hypothetical protein